MINQVLLHLVILYLQNIPTTLHRLSIGVSIAHARQHNHARIASDLSQIWEQSYPALAAKIEI